MELNAASIDDVTGDMDEHGIERVPMADPGFDVCGCLFNSLNSLLNISTRDRCLTSAIRKVLLESTLEEKVYFQVRHLNYPIITLFVNRHPWQWIRPSCVISKHTEVLMIGLALGRAIYNSSSTGYMAVKCSH